MKHGLILGFLFDNLKYDTINDLHGQIINILMHLNELNFQYGFENDKYPLDKNWFSDILQNHIVYHCNTDIFSSRANKTGFNLIIFHFTIRGKLSIIRCDKRGGGSFDTFA